MNALVKQFAEQSRYFTETYDNELLSEPALVYCFHKEDFEKFVELFVRECAEVAACNAHVSGFALGDLLKQHFGVQA